MCVTDFGSVIRDRAIVWKGCDIIKVVIFGMNTT